MNFLQTRWASVGAGFVIGAICLPFLIPCLIIYYLFRLNLWWRRHMYGAYDINEVVLEEIDAVDDGQLEFTPADNWLIVATVIWGIVVGVLAWQGQLTRAVITGLILGGVFGAGFGWYFHPGGFPWIRERNHHR